MTIGTGIGGAIIVNGALYRGWKGSAGELGHLCIDYQGRQCICGAHGCLEAYVAGPAIEREFFRKTARNSSISNKNGNSNIRLENIVKLAQDGNIDAQAVIKDAGYYLGCGLYGLLNTLNPEIVIIGGGVVNTGALFLDEARRVVSSKALSPMKTHLLWQLNWKAPALILSAQQFPVGNSSGCKFPKNNHTPPIKHLTPTQWLPGVYW
jgi:glucokinase